MSIFQINLNSPTQYHLARSRQTAPAQRSKAQGRAPRLALGAFVTLLPAAMIPAALLSLGFPKPPDYSVLSRRLLSLQSDEVCAGGVGDG